MKLLPKQYDAAAIAKKWYAYWLEKDFFSSKPNADKEPYTVVMPPPNITGKLHMGHLLNNTIQDVLVRRARMQGKEACWVPGIDHASIATEAKVVEKLKEEGINKKTLTRETFLPHAWEWKEKYGGIILAQLRELGISCDWNRTTFTLDPSLVASVTSVFIKLHEEGYIYRDTRMINWDPAGETALADDEVFYEEVEGKLYYIRFKLVDEEGELLVATTRPETLQGDTALCVHPDDERYKKWHGKHFKVPFTDRTIPLIADSYIDPAFGTGVLKVTPAHGVNDYLLAKRHNLPLISLMEADGTFSTVAGVYAGLDRFVVRERIVTDLREADLLERVTPHRHNVGLSERTRAVVEPRLSTQWFVKMQELAKPALAKVLEGDIRFYPNKFQGMYRHWLENVHDWCISRQLWWGHRIPAYYLPDGSYVVAATVEEALAKAQQRMGASFTLAQLRQDEDTLDTWFSSWLWPFSVFDGLQHPDNADIKYYYPTNDLVTAPEIIFFWVARMVMASCHFMDKIPFRNVYFTGLVRDKQGRKMSKSLGNSPDALALIKQYGADGVRTGMLFSSPAGNDLPFDEKLCAQGAQFAHKLWNALRLVHGWEVSDSHQHEQVEIEELHKTALAWMHARQMQLIQQVEDLYAQFRISEVLILLYRFVWDEFCAHYLEMIKPKVGASMPKAVYEASIGYFEVVMKLLHPFMPFITEEIWHHLRTRSDRESLAVATAPLATSYDSVMLEAAQDAFMLINKVRQLRAQHGYGAKHLLQLAIEGELPGYLTAFRPYIIAQCGLSAIVIVGAGGDEQTSSFTAWPLSGKVYSLIDIAPAAQKTASESEESKQALAKELQHLKKFLKAIEQKLHSASFIAKAPAAVVTRERKKQQDAAARIIAIERMCAGE